MTDHMKAAVEAGAQVAYVEDWGKAFEPGNPFRHGYEEHARATLNAALPHIRAMIAEEVEAAGLSRGEVRSLVMVGHTVDYAEGYDRGIAMAARIVRGETS